MLSERFPEYQVPGRQVHNFNPYESNGGYENLNNEVRCLIVMMFYFYTGA